MLALERPRMPRSDTPTTAFAAQHLGQPSAKRGLREGPPALDRARNAYLSTEWSGADDRRPPSGLIRRDTV